MKREKNKSGKVAYFGKEKSIKERLTAEKEENGEREREREREREGERERERDKKKERDFWMG